MVLVVLDEILRMAKVMRIPPLAVGLGIYLPMSATLFVVIGAVIGHVYDTLADKRRRGRSSAKRLGVLLASGLIVGESLFGVINAGLVSAAQTGFLWMPKDAPSAQAPLGVLPAAFPESALGVVLTSGRLRGDHRRALSVGRAPGEGRGEVTGTARAPFRIPAEAR